MTDQHKAFVFYQLVNEKSSLSIAVADSKPAGAEEIPQKVQDVLTKPVYTEAGDPAPNQIGFGLRANDLDLDGLQDLWTGNGLDRSPDSVASALAIAYPGGGPCPPFKFDLAVRKALIP